MISVLIVEDEVYLLQELAETVPWKRYGFHVTAVTGSYEEAVTLYNLHRPDLVITDIRLPGGNGLDLLKVCRPRFAIVITGHDLFDYAHEALRLGVVDFLLKPIDDDELDRARRRVQILLAGGRGAGGREMETAFQGEGDEERPDTRERHVRAAEDFIRRRYREDVSLEDAAADLGLSSSYLSRLIRDLRDRTFVEMLTAFRLQIAVELLRDQRLRVGEVAERCGFSDQGYFARIFRRHFGTSPTVFRSRSAGDGDSVLGKKG